MFGQSLNDSSPDPAIPNGHNQAQVSLLTSLPLQSLFVFGCVMVESLYAIENQTLV